MPRHHAALWSVVVAVQLWPAAPAGSEAALFTRGAARDFLECVRTDFALRALSASSLERCRQWLARRCVASDGAFPLVAAHAIEATALALDNAAGGADPFDPRANALAASALDVSYMAVQWLVRQARCVEDMEAAHDLRELDWNHRWLRAHREHVLALRSRLPEIVALPPSEALAAELARAEEAWGDVRRVLGLTPQRAR